MDQGTILQAVQHQDKVLDHLLSDPLFLRHEFNVYQLHNPCQVCSTSHRGVSPFPTTSARCTGLLGRSRTYPAHGVFSRHDERGLCATPDSLPSLIPASSGGYSMGSYPSSSSSHDSGNGVGFLLSLSFTILLTWFVFRSLSLIPTRQSQLPQEALQQWEQLSPPMRSSLPLSPPLSPVREEHWVWPTPASPPFHLQSPLLEDPPSSSHLWA